MHLMKIQSNEFKNKINEKENTLPQKNHQNKNNNNTNNKRTRIYYFQNALKSTITYYIIITYEYLIASVVEGLESMTSNPVTSLAWVRTPGGALVV
jgi:hypothetical protein